MFDESSEPFTATIADLAALRAADAKTLCRRKIEAIATTTDQLNHTPEEAAAFKPWCAAMRKRYHALKTELTAVGDFWNPIETPDQESYDAKDIGYNEAVAAIDITAGWPEWKGFGPSPPAPEAPDVEEASDDDIPPGLERWLDMSKPIEEERERIKQRLFDLESMREGRIPMSPNEEDEWKALKDSELWLKK